MKYLFTLLFCFALILPTKAGNDKFVETMKGILIQMDSARTPEQFQEVANRFERIANAEPKEWLPNYYVAFCYNMMAFMAGGDGEKVDPLLDKAQEYLNKSKEVKKSDKSEILVLQGMIYSGRIGVDPQTRGMEFGPKAGMTYGKAQAENENNPRAWYMLGQNTLFTPEQWGGGKAKALPLLEKAMELYDSVEPESEIHPNWGRENCEESLLIAKGEKKMPWMEEGQEEE